MQNRQRPAMRDRPLMRKMHQGDRVATARHGHRDRRWIIREKASVQRRLSARRQPGQGLAQRQPASVRTEVARVLSAAGAVSA